MNRTFQTYVSSITALGAVQSQYQHSATAQRRALTLSQHCTSLQLLELYGSAISQQKAKKIMNSHL